jgi:RNA polymerase sigma factor (sigma-70 family)
MNDDDQKIERLWRYRPAVMAYMKRNGFSPEDADDLTQQVFVRVCQNVDAYRGDAAWGYLELVAKSVCANAIRARLTQKRHAVEVPEESAVSVPDTHNPRADQNLEDQEERERLLDLIEHLDEAHKQPVLLYLADMSYEEIGHTLGITPSAVKSRLNVARRRLKGGE